MKKKEINYFKDLNTEQKKAVETIKGPLLVLAGAGTGKTKVLTTRLANLLYSKAAVPSEICAVTFTNKAANEMRFRVEKMLNKSVAGWWLGTFHSIAARILRANAELVSLKRGDGEGCTTLSTEMKLFLAFI